LKYEHLPNADQGVNTYFVPNESVILNGGMLLTNAGLKNII